MVYNFKHLKERYGFNCDSDRGSSLGSDNTRRDYLSATWEVRRVSKALHSTVFKLSLIHI